MRKNSTSRDGLNVCKATRGPPVKRYNFRKADMVEVDLWEMWWLPAEVASAADIPKALIRGGSAAMGSVTAISQLQKRSALAFARLFVSRCT